MAKHAQFLRTTRFLPNSINLPIRDDELLFTHLVPLIKVVIGAFCCVTSVKWNYFPTMVISLRFEDTVISMAALISFEAPPVF
jgi:hypothetical protein